MRNLKEGDKSAAVCPICKKQVSTTFKLGNFWLVEPRIEVKDILIGYCDECGTAVAIPRESTPKIREVRANFGAKRHVE